MCFTHDFTHACKILHTVCKTFAHAACKTFEHAFLKRRVKLYPRACKTLAIFLQYFTHARVKLRPTGMVLPTRVKFYPRV